MEKKEELINILKTSPQWIMLNQSSWFYMPWALFNCFCSIVDEDDPTKKQLQILLNEVPKILVISSNPKKLYTDNLLNTMVDGFEGKSSEHLMTYLKEQNKWETEADIALARMRPLYSSFDEFIIHFQEIILQYNPTHIIIDGQVNVDTDYNDSGVIFDSQDLAKLYKDIQGLQGVHQIQKIITDQYFYKVPYNQVKKDAFFFSMRQQLNNAIVCNLKMIKGFENKGEFEVHYQSKLNSFLQSQSLISKFKLTCYHSGRIKA